MLWGPPGIGKTALVNAVARQLELPLETVVIALREPTDLAGLPVVSGDRVNLSPPGWAMRLWDAGKGILFLDEFSCAPPAVQAAALRVVAERVVGDLRLPDGIAIVGAANPPDQAADGWVLPAPSANRWVHLEVKADPAEWTRQFPSYWGNPPTLPHLTEAEWARNRALVAAFIKARPSLLCALPRDPDAQGKAWPSPRTWDYVSRLIHPDGGDEEAIAGAVGEAAALEFIAWRRELDLPDPDELLKKPDGFRPPERIDRLYAVLHSVVSAALGNLTPDRWLAAWRILSIAAKTRAPDVAAVAAARLAEQMNEKLPSPPDEVIDIFEDFLKMIQRRREEQ